MKSDHLESIKRALDEAGIEIYQELADRLVIAERIRVHIMDSGVHLTLDPTMVCLSIRSQLSDFPNQESQDQFNRVRESSIIAELTAHDFVETGTSRREILDPIDESKVLDVWFELAFEKKTNATRLVDDVKWSLSIDKCLSA